jgi:hypothetical protein
MNIACKLTNPISGFGKVLENMFQGIARSISF